VWVAENYGSQIYRRYIIGGLVKFKVGDRVKVIYYGGPLIYKHVIGVLGTVIEVIRDSSPYGDLRVRLDEAIFDAADDPNIEIFFKSELEKIGDEFDWITEVL
jgi:hypothetical protein